MNEHPAEHEYIKQLEILRQVDTELNRYLNIDYVLAIGLDAAVRLGNAQAGAIHLLESDQLRVVQVIGEYPTELMDTCVPLNRGLAARSLRRQRPELVLDVHADPDYVPNVAGTRAQMSIPLLSYDRPIGVLNIQTAMPERFTESIFNFVQLLAARMAVAVENARLYEQLKGQLAELTGLYRRVSHLEQIKSDMIRMAAHDLRNPLNNIMGAFELLRLDMPESMAGASAPLFDIIQQSITRMRSIVTDILSLERIEQMATGAHKLVNLQAAAHRAYHEYEAQAQQKGLHFSLNTVTADVMGIETQLYEAISNLVGNAIKYTPPGGQVEIAVAADEHRAIFEVRDTGFGIPREEQDKLFQPFFRARSQETSDIEGTGLGLHMVKRVVEQHHGAIRFTSRYGQGSTFGFELPLADDGA